MKSNLQENHRVVLTELFATAREMVESYRWDIQPAVRSTLGTVIGIAESLLTEKEKLFEELRKAHLELLGYKRNEANQNLAKEVAEHAAKWVDDIGDCLFCTLQNEMGQHEDFCPVGKYMGATRPGEGSGATGNEDHP